MRSKFIKEQHRYTKGDLCEIFDCLPNELLSYIKTLKSYSILKTVKNTSGEKDRSDLQDEEVVVSSIDDDASCYYVFSFVGVIIINGFVLKCYPKYITKNCEPTNELKQVIKVVEKYNNTSEQIIKMMSDTIDGKSFNLLAVLLYLLHDYNENGVYSNSKDIIEINGRGEINWDKTINETFAFIVNNRPYYFDLFTKKTADDEYDYFKRLHECILTNVSKDLKNADLLDLFGLTEVNLSEECLEDFGDIEYICYRIERELNVQFNTRKQQVLKTLYAYVSKGSTLYDINANSIYGTTNFNLVWENVCSEIFDNQLQKLIRDIKLPISLREDKFDKNMKLIDLIEKPVWSITNMVADKTLIPDIVSIAEIDGGFTFAILDAKYYTPILEPFKLPKSVPGIESVTKQYLYQLAYKDFIEEHGFSGVINCFLLPTEEDEVIDKGDVSLNMLLNLGLENIEVRLIPVRKAYEYYLMGKKMEIVDLEI